MTFFIFCPHIFTKSLKSNIICFTSPQKKVMNNRSSGAFNAIISLLWLTTLFCNPLRCTHAYQQLKCQSAQVIFNAIGFKDMAKHQLISCIKKYDLKPAKEAQNLDKEKTLH